MNVSLRSLQTLNSVILLGSLVQYFKTPPLLCLLLEDISPRSKRCSVNLCEWRHGGDEGDVPYAEEGPALCQAGAEPSVNWNSSSAFPQGAGGRGLGGGVER